MEYSPGMIVEGVVTGVQPYGAFLKIDDKIDGLIHISEISSGFVNDVQKFVSIGEKIKVKIIDYDKKTNHLSLSLKALSNQPIRKEKRKGVFVSNPKFTNEFAPFHEKLKEWMEEITND